MYRGYNKNVKKTKLCVIIFSLLVVFGGFSKVAASNASVFDVAVRSGGIFAFHGELTNFSVRMMSNILNANLTKIDRAKPAQNHNAESSAQAFEACTAENIGVLYRNNIKFLIDLHPASAGAVSFDTLENFGFNRGKNSPHLLWAVFLVLLVIMPSRKKDTASIKNTIININLKINRPKRNIKTGGFSFIYNKINNNKMYRGKACF